MIITNPVLEFLRIYISEVVQDFIYITRKWSVSHLEHQLAHFLQADS